MIFATFLAQGQITLITTSSSTNWSPQLVTKTGATLHWEATNALIGTLTQDENDPTFDFSANDGSDINITVTSSDGFDGLTALDFWNDNGTGSDITAIDVSQAKLLTLLNMRYNYLSSLDVSANTELETLNIRGHRQLLGQTLNTSFNTKLTSIQIDVSGINSVDFSNNPLLTSVIIDHARLTTDALNQVLIDLDAHGQTGGNLKVDGNTKPISSASLTAYNNLIAKGWTIDVPAPVPNIETITLKTTSNNSVWQLGRMKNDGGLTLHWKAEFENTGTLIQEFDDDRPIFDFSSNANNDPISITITSEDGFDHLTEMSLYIGTPSVHNPSDIFQIDIANADALERLYPAESSLDSIDISQNINLKRLLIHGDNTQLSDQTYFDISNNPNLYSLFVSNTNISSISSLLQNPLIYTLDLTDSQFPSAVLDQVLIDLDQNGINNPPTPDLNPDHIMLAGNPGSLTSTSYTAYNNLIAKGWTIDVPAPPAAPGPDINITGLGIDIPGNGTNTPSTSDDTAFGQTASGTSITKTFTIENQGDDVLDLTGNPDLVSIIGTNASDFTVSGLPTTPVAVGGPPTSFDVTFNANSLGIRTAVITVESNDPDEASYTFNIQAESTQAPGPEINVTGNNISIPSGNTPIITDGTDFGQVAIGSPVTKTFTIENLGDSDLTIYSGTTNGTAGFSQDPSYINPTIVPGGPPTSFDVTFTADNALGVQTAQIIISSNDADENPYFINLTAEGIGVAVDGSIHVEGGNPPLLIEGDATNTSILADGTDFGTIINGDTKTNTFTIVNDGPGELEITNINIILDTEFSIVNTPDLPITLANGATTSFDVQFAPTVSGTYKGLVQISNSDPGTNKDPYQFNITGESTVPQDIMITQYYEGNTKSKWIEIKNISDNQISAGTYFLALFDNNQLVDIENQTPVSLAIPDIAPGEVILFSNQNPVMPTSAHINPNVTIIPTAVCDFTGNDVILLSTTDDATSYTNRVDMIGSLDPNNRWGGETSFIRGGCSSELPNPDYVSSEWIELSIEGEVNIANVDSNIAIGTQAIGSTTWISGNWENMLPDRTRNVVIESPYASSNGSIESCSLTINSDVNFDQGTQNYIIVEKELTINSNGSLVLGDEESLVTIDPVANITGVITKNEKSVPLLNIHDNTYWSSPVENETIERVFVDKGVDPSRIFYLNPADINQTWAGTDYKHWFVASGGMEKGRGYAVEGYSTGEQLISFAGKPNNGSISFTVHYTGTPDTGSNDNNNMNLAGNPYPSTISIDPFLTDEQNNNLEKTIYLWTHNTPISGEDSGDFVNADYAKYVVGSGGVAAGSGGAKPNGYLASSQGFMVRTIATGNGQINFENDDRVVDSIPVFFKQGIDKKKSAKNERDRIWLNMTTDKNGFKQILIGFFENATDEIDIFFDGKQLKSNNPINFYSTIKNEKFAIQGLSKFTSDKMVALGFDTKGAPRTISINIDQIEGQLKDADVYLVDNKLGITHNLKEGPYSFEQKEAGNFPDRFTLQFATAALGVDDFVKDNDFSITNADNGFNINASKVVNHLKVYDMLGRMILNQHPNKQSFNVQTENIKQGTVLIFEVTLENGAILNKKTIKY